MWWVASTSGRHHGAFGGDAEIAGEGERKAGAGSGARQRGNRRLRHLVEAAGGRTLAQALAMDACVDRLGLGAVLRLGHALHVAACAERDARAGEHHGADVGVRLACGQRIGEGGDHRRGQRVAPLRPVHRDDGDAVVDVGEEVGRAGVDGA